MNLKNAGHIKIKLLVDGMRLHKSATEGLGKIWQEKIYSYSLTDWVDKKIVLPSDIKISDRVFIGFRFNPQSEWELYRNDNDLFIRSIRGMEIPAKLIPRPSYYDLETNDGKKMQSIGVSCGNHGISFFLNSYCEYFKYGENCKFCGLVPTQKIFSDTVKLKKVEQVRETIETILDLGCPMDFVQLSGGSLYDHDTEIRNYIPFVSVISEELEKRGLKGRIPIHLTTMPPKNLSILNELRGEGLDTISFDLECTTQKFFEKYCPGKTNSYGYRNIRNALKVAQEVFSHGNVYSIVIMGIESQEIFAAGLEEIIQDGVVPTLNVYHHDPFCSPDMDIKNPKTDELIETAYEISKLFKKYGAVPGRLGCAHYDIGHEIKKGYFGENVR